MNTEQSYVGKGDSATTLPQMDETTLLGTPSPDDWRVEFLHHCLAHRERINSLFKIIDMAKSHYESTNAVPVLCRLIEHFLLKYQQELEEEDKRNLGTALRLIAFLTDLHENYDDFNVMTDYAVASETNEDFNYSPA